MNKIMIVLFLFGIVYAIDDVSFPNRFPTSPARISDLVEDFDSLVSGTNKIIDTITNKYVRKQFFKDTTWDTLKSRWGKLDTIRGDTGYYRTFKTTSIKIDTIRVYKIVTDSIFINDTGTFVCSTSTGFLSVSPISVKYYRVGKHVTLTFPASAITVDSVAQLVIKDIPLKLCPSASVAAASTYLPGFATNYDNTQSSVLFCSVSYDGLITIQCPQVITKFKRGSSLVMNYASIFYIKY